MSKTTETFRGHIAACSRVEQFRKKNGQDNVKCVLHIVGADGAERAITATGEHTNWVGCQGMEVEVEYVNRVFPFQHNGMDWYGNDLYAVNITSISTRL